MGRSNLGCVAVVGCIGEGSDLEVNEVQEVNVAVMDCIGEGFDVEVPEVHEVKEENKGEDFVFEAVGVVGEEDFLLVGVGCRPVGSVIIERLSRKVGWQYT